MIIALGTDHAAFVYKEVMRQVIESMGHTVLDCGTNSVSPVDYPVISVKVARAVREGKAERGVFLCGTGIGGSIAANKVHGIRAALCHETYSARMARDHNDANMLCMGARVIGISLAEDVLRVFLSTEYSDDPRHQRRIDQLNATENV